MLLILNKKFLKEILPNRHLNAQKLNFSLLRFLIP